MVGSGDGRNCRADRELDGTAEWVSIALNHLQRHTRCQFRRSAALRPSRGVQGERKGEHSGRSPGRRGSTRHPGTC